MVKRYILKGEVNGNVFKEERKTKMSYLHKLANFFLNKSPKLFNKPTKKAALLHYFQKHSMFLIYLFSFKCAEIRVRFFAALIICQITLKCYFKQGQTGHNCFMLM